ncbi:hypothetical protein H0H81_000200 [Sphagnurus paluster]|uniref:Peptidase S9 prolyl oligopeptidase catalytic domain-containing protein n=1 Tax=Sphagnurus paluster TaxID=117069 RepID=A0A9P7K3A8_9AGAR|nr:hypothetical protein H0H81_000200 [Sphagnurus paluster]
MWPVTIADVIVDPVTEKVYHIEARAAEDGRNTIVETLTSKELTPGKNWNVRTVVQEYGGAPAIVYNDVAYFSCLPDNRVYQVKLGQTPEPVTPKVPKDAHRFANFDVFPGHEHLLVSILEDHTDDTPATVVTGLCIIDTKTKSVHSLVAGAANEFYISPKFSPDGKRIAWQQWSHPDMPWEGGRIYIAEVHLTGDSVSLKHITHVAGEALKVSAAFPSWASNDTLIFTSDVSGFINPWKYHVASKKSSALLPQPVKVEFGVPQWYLQLHPYVILDGYLLFVTIENSSSKLNAVDLDGGVAAVAFDSPFVDINYIRVLSRKNNEFVFTGAKTDEDTCIAQVSLSSFAPGPISFILLRRPADPPFTTNFVSLPKTITLQSNQQDIHVIYYPPHNPAYSGSSIPGERPPCVVDVHGGPTGSASQSLNWKVQLFTSRGWAWLDVNYSGSSGYGRAYIERLAGKWGILDVEDCLHSVKQLDDHIDIKRTVIRGGSAGGYTTLCALACAPDVTAFAAGTSMYGISNLEPLLKHTHKFESHYVDKLIGGTFAEIPEVYKDRSPLTHADRIVSPLLLLQGADDPIVPKEQAEQIEKIIKDRHGDVEYKLYLGESHGWRKQETIRDALQRELSFYERVLNLQH